MNRPVDGIRPLSRRLVAMAFLLAAVWVGISARAHAGLIITPTFDSTITSDPNAAAIKGVINQAIGVYETHFKDPINVSIDFAEMSSGLGQSSYTVYKISYQQFINQLVADKTTTDDATALAHLPKGANNPVNNTTSINVKPANARAIGISLGSGFDGTVKLNTHITDIGSPGTSGQYSLSAVAEHEIDEVLGLGSDAGGTGFFSDPVPEDLFRYTLGPGGVRSYTNTGDNAYFSIDGGTTDLVRFNQGNNAGGDYGDWWSNNGGGNPGTNPPARVQDAFAVSNRHPVLGVELRALDVIGYDFVPEPGSITLLIFGLACLALHFASKR
ncbi:MAG TPA: NF038122 family metalloprotease [Pirellulales bacterium]|nr:NF038122 family metalloprotease [Pirellulales bacterium]